MSRTIRIFVSSTFSDMKAERDVLQRLVFPRLRRLCMTSGVRFQAIDLRWGVSAEAGRDNRTMRICLRELARCQAGSLKPNFLILLGDRYGWRPLPEVIPADLYDRLISRMQVDFSAEAALMARWYRRDENAWSDADARPAAEYVLQPRPSAFADYEVWSREVEAPLLTALGKTAAALGEDPQLKALAIGDSATHQEISRGALAVKDAATHVHALVREIRGLPTHPPPKDFVDLDEKGGRDKAAGKRLDDLKVSVKAHLGGANFHPYKVEWREDGFTDAGLDEFRDKAFKALETVVRRQIEFVMGLSPEEQESRAQDEFAAERCRGFVGRRESLARIAGHLSRGTGHPLAVLGSSGSGKSALLAKAAGEARNAHPEPKAAVLARFIGVTPGSSDIVPLLRDLVAAIRRLYPAPVAAGGGLNEGDRADEVPAELAPLVKAFHGALARPDEKRPLLLFIDALDQLSSAENARRLNWLPASLPGCVRLVVSAALPPLEANACDPRVEVMQELERRFPSDDQRLLLGPLDRDAGAALLEQWLHEDGRMLQPCQRDPVLQAFAAEGSPLWLRAAAGEAARWASWQAPTSLPPSVGELLGQVLDRLAAPGEHGEVLVDRALGYLACARRGLAEDEVLDVLSLDPEVMGDFRTRFPKSPEVDTLPVAVWAPLRGDIQRYLTERQSGGDSLLNFYHRSLLEAVELRSLRDAGARSARHAHLAGYFEKQQGSAHGLVELPYQLAHSGQSERLERILCSIAYLHERCRLADVFELVTDFGLTGGHGSGQIRECDDYEAFLRRHAHRLNRFRDLVFSLAYHEGFPSALAQARQLAKDNVWHRPWLRMDERPLPKDADGRKAPGLELETVTKVDFDHACLACVAPEAGMAYRMSGLGRLGIIDMSVGRLLSVEIPVRRSRILRLSCSPEGRFLAAAFEDGRGDILRVEADVGTESLRSSQFDVFEFLMPKYESPILRCTADRLWYQDRQGSIAWVSLKDGVKARGVLDLPAAAAGSELSGLEPWGDRLLITLRKGVESLAVMHQPGAEPLVHPFGKMGVTALCVMDDERVAFALSDARTVICRYRQGFKEVSSFSTDDPTLVLAAAGGALVGVTQMGAIWSVDEKTRPPALRSNGMSRVHLGAEALRLNPDGSLILAAAANVMRFRLKCCSGGPREELLEVFPVHGSADAVVLRNREETLWVVRTGHPDQVPLGSKNSWSVAYNREQGLLLAYAFDGQAMFIDVRMMRRGKVFHLPVDCRCTADPKGGFWIFAQPGSLCHLSESGRYDQVAEVDLRLAGPVQLRCDDAECPFLLIEAPCHVQSRFGGEVFPTLCFYRISEGFGGARKLKKIGAWSIPAAQGRLQTWVYLPSLGQYLLKVEERFCIGSAEDLASEKGNWFTVPGLSENCYRSAATAESPWAFLLGALGNLYLVDVARRELQVVYSGTAMVTDIASEMDRGPLRVISGRGELRDCHVENVGGD